MAEAATRRFRGTEGGVTRGRALVLPCSGLVVASGAVAWLHYTGGYNVLPGGLLACPLHTATGLWCPFCGGLRCLAALSRGDLPTAASSNVAVLALLPVAVGWWLLTAHAAWRSARVPAVTNRGWLVLGAVMLVFTVWRNIPALPLSDFLAP